MLFLPPEELRELDARALEQLLGRTDCTVAFADGDVRGLAAAALLFADYAVLHAGATLTVDTPEAWGGAAWRLGRGALRWHLRGAPSEDIVDEIVDADARDWFARWMQGRSAMALDSAAALTRMRGGDRLERAEFARLFAAGEPQKGMAAFLGKREAKF
ncbi:MAG: hypothetical protein ABI779_15100 [Acidobacteriota bacterium]